MAATTHVRPLAASRPGRHLPALDGLRGLAVAAVVLFHLDARWLRGGYLGVDVFFALSGYLITRLLLAELAQTRRISLPTFWTRRARRLLPGMLLVVAAMAVLLQSLDPVERGRRVSELLGCLAYVANWQLIESGTTYFHESAVVSPLRHLWSLAIEEQFYVFWPLAVWAARSRRAVGWVAFVGAVTSVGAMAVLYDPQQTTRAYFGTDARVHQILVGCLAAVLLDARPERLSKVRAHAGMAPLVGLAVLAWSLPGTSAAYYWGGSLVVALLAVWVIVAIVAEAPWVVRLLSARWLRHLGERSYGLYLVHWPVIVLVDASLVGFEGLPLAAVQVVLAVVLAELSFVLVERPIRSGRPWGFELSPRRMLRLVPASLAVSVAFVVLAGTGRTSPPPWAGDTGASNTELTEADDRPVTTSDGTEPAVRRVAILGDSVAWSLSSGLQHAAAVLGLDFGTATASGCPVGLDPLYNPDGTPYDETQACATAVPAAHDAIRSMAPDLIIWHDFNSMRARRGADGSLLQDGPLWEASLFASWDVAVAAIRPPGSDLVIVVPPLRSRSPAGACATDEHPDRCEEVQREDDRIRTATRRYVEQRADPHLHVIDVDDLVCASLPCPAVVDGIQLRAGGLDLTHFTAAGAEWLAPQLLERALAAVSP